MDSKHFYNPSYPSFPIIAIAAFGILATVLLLLSYYFFVTKCCSSWHPACLLRWFSSGQSQEEEDSFIALSPTMWNRGLDESVIRDIPIFQFRRVESEEHRSVFGCIVCLNDFQDQDMLRVLPNCSHAFHLDCVDIWLQTNAHCPLCRTSVSGTVRYPFNCIVAPSSSPQGSQVPTESLMGSDEDFVVIELGDENGTMQQMQQQRNEITEVPAELRRHSSRKFGSKLGNMLQRKQHHVSIMGDECIDIREKDNRFSIQPIRRSFSLDSANDQQLLLTVQEIIQQHSCQSEARGGEACVNRFTRSFFPCGLGQRYKNAVRPVECDI